MQLLLLDNHDSFSAILHHYLWELTGVKPWFHRNDGLTREELRALSFDAAVLSPGPGHPAQARDFGICRDLLELFPGKPILGICLGHQGLALFAGARVVRHPEARHGRASRILHDGEGLFHGLPQGFPAVRYHSLVVAAESIPSNIQVTARSADDGQIMGLAFRDRPWFGAQFHPESIGTEYGKALLANFLDRAEPNRVRPVPSSIPAVHPSGPAGEARYRELSWKDPEAVFIRHFAAAPAVFWLDGSRAHPDAGWPATFMGRADVIRKLRERGMETLRWDPLATRWLRDWRAGNPLDLFQAHCQATAESPRASAPWPGYQGGPVGQFSYEWHRLTLSPTAQAFASHAAEEPLGRWMDPEGYLVFHHAEQRVFAAWENPGGPPAWLQTVCETWETSVLPLKADENTLPPESEWKPQLSAQEYADRVRALQRSIADGDTYEACMTQALTVEAEADALQVFRRLRLRNPAPYAAYLVFDDVRMLSASPELFLELSPEGQLRSRPIKGTRPRGHDAESDAAWREELGRDPKDKAENLMIVDLTRHDFSLVCALGSVQVTSLFQVEAHPAVFQLVSEVRGRLAADRNFLEAVWACFPGGSMTGAPKERTVELLAACEAGPRGVFSGALGYFTRGPAFCLAMVIRTLENRERFWRVGCGGAVLAESDPDAEWREALLKARSVIDAAARTAVTKP